MARVRKGTILGTTEILRHKDFTAIPVMLDSTLEVDGKVVIEKDGRKIAKAGMILGGGFLEGDKVATHRNAASAEGVLRYDVDITDGDREVSAIIRGEIYEDKLPEELDAGARESLATRILFIK